jgi:DNA-binding response OmpR family regulator
MSLGYAAETFPFGEAFLSRTEPVTLPAAGALGFLAKPFNDEELVACLDAALARRKV